MVAGMLSVLLVFGLIGLGVWAATNEPAAAPRSVARTPASPAAPAETPTPSAEAVKPLPKVKRKSLAAAARAAGCTVSHPRDEGVEHASQEFTAADYGTNPPTSGTHNPDWYEDGIYTSGTTPHLGMLVHALEHGRIEVQYAPGTDAATVARLERLADELEGGYHLLLFENGTEMPFAVAATAWGHLLGCPGMNDRVFDALRAFRNTYIDKGPEVVP